MRCVDDDIFHKGGNIVEGEWEAKADYRADTTQQDTPWRTYGNHAYCQGMSS